MPHLRQQVVALRPAYGVHGLNNHLAQPLAGAHNIGGVHCLVRADQDKALCAAAQRRISGLICTHHIILNGLVGAILHQGHMLVRRRVIDDLRTIFFKHLLHAAAVAHGADQHRQVQLRKAAPQLLLNGIGVVFVNIEDHKMAGVVSCDLATQLTADTPAAACDQNSLTGELPENLTKIYLNRLAPQQILHLHRLQLIECHFTVGQLVQSRKAFQHTARFAA